ncbi:D123-domain-containing protein, partial [Saccharata proteae CBS 121410]
LPFPPITKQHILNCSYHSWHPRYRAVTPKARLIPLSDSFITYLRADGIVLPPDDSEQHDWSDSDSGIFSSTENPTAPPDDSDDEDDDPSSSWPDVHQSIKSTIEDLGGKVVPKLNWSAPKDATWISATNSMECRAPNDIYLLLKSSDFVTHDLEHAFDDTADHDDPSTMLPSEIPYHLILRKAINLNPSLEFRCFVRRRRLLALCQRDLNHFEFLFRDNMADRLRQRIQEFFDIRMRDTFPDENFVFDVYVPPPHDRVWLVDVNPWAQRTDPLLFGWLELLTMDEPKAGPHDREDELNHDDDDGEEEEVVRIPLKPQSQQHPAANPAAESDGSDTEREDNDSASESSEEEADEEIFIPEFRLVKKDDPEAYGFTTPQYSAHKLPRDVVDASRGGEGSLREFANQWKEVLEKRQRDDQEESSDD